MTKQVFNEFTNISNEHYNSVDKPLLEEIQFSVEEYRFKIKVGDENTVIKKYKNEAMVMAIDKGQIS